MITKKPAVAVSELGASVFEGLKISKNALPIEQSFHFWQVAGIKGYSSFSKKFKKISILQNGDELQIIKLKREADGSYSYLEEEEKLEILSCTPKNLGETIKKVWMADETLFLKLAEWKHSYGNTFLYVRPDSLFIDQGMGIRMLIRSLHTKDPKSFCFFNRQRIFRN